MKKFSIIFLALFLVCATFAQQPPKREVRAVWLSTAWRLDFPQTLGVANQQNELLTILDRLEASNYNTIYFQVRPMHDAFYRSSLPTEPWSQWLTGTRGQDPGWSPLGFLIEHAHARGMEVHAWLNPYRYSTNAATHGTLPTDIATTRPEWLIDYEPYDVFHHRILNPGIPEVKTYIAHVVGDILRNYNVDGIVFDDFFYRNGITTDAHDQLQFDAYRGEFPDTPQGRADWRRNNVNTMIREVQDTINSISPWIQWGISPAGIAVGGNTNPEHNAAQVAALYGVRTLPGTIDWQRAGKFVSPVAWLRDGTIDYISPQIYWDTTEGGTGNPPFERASEWWAEVANQFGRHFFSSNASHRGGNTDRSLATFQEFSTAEILNQVQILRNVDRNGTAGQVHFRYLTYLPPINSNNNYDALRDGPYRYPALTAAFGWKPAPMQGLVTNLNVSGQDVTWNYVPNCDFDVRFAIYAVPNANRDDADAFTSSRHLQGMSWTTNFTLPAGINATTHKIAVAVFDRFGNLFPVRVLGENETTIPPVQLTFPANNATDVVIPSIFTWEANGADFYVWQIAEDADFERPIASRETTSPYFNLALQGNIKPNTTYYWRVKSIRANAPVSVSEVRVFNGDTQFQILTPAAGETDVSRTPEITWTSMGDDVTYTLEISMQANFSSIIHTITTQTTNVTIPYGILRIATTYHARIKTKSGTVQIVLDQIQFTTEDVAVSVPTIISPVDGETITGRDITITWEEQVSRDFRVQWSRTASFPPVGTTNRSVDFSEFSTTFSDLDEGIYFFRVMGITSTGLTAPSAVVRVYLDEVETSVPDGKVPEFFQIYRVSDGISNLVINQTENNSVVVEVFSVTGNLLDRQIHGLSAGTHTLMLDMINYARGIYLVRVSAGNNTKTLRVQR